MEFIQWFVIICMVFLMVMSVFKTDVLRLISKNDRIQRATSNAKDNVRFHDTASMAIYKPHTRVALSDDESDFELISIHPPFNLLRKRLRQDDLYHDPFLTCDTGIVHYRVALNNADIGNQLQRHPTYTPEEEKRIAERTKIELSDAQGRIIDLEANKVREIEETVNNVSQLTSAKTIPRGK